MGVNSRVTVERLQSALTKSKATLVSFVYQRIEVRRSRIEREKKFYDNLHTYYRENKNIIFWDEDWRSGG